jgi:hypothetical protein
VKVAARVVIWVVTREIPVKERPAVEVLEGALELMEVGMGIEVLEHRQYRQHRQHRQHREEGEEGEAGSQQVTEEMTKEMALLRKIEFKLAAKTLSTEEVKGHSSIFK